MNLAYLFLHCLYTHRMLAFISMICQKGQIPHCPFHQKGKCCVFRYLLSLNWESFSVKALEVFGQRLVSQGALGLKVQPWRFTDKAGLVGGFCIRAASERQTQNWTSHLPLTGQLWLKLCSLKTLQEFVFVSLARSENWKWLFPHWRRKKAVLSGHWHLYSQREVKNWSTSWPIWSSRWWTGSYFRKYPGPIFELTTHCVLILCNSMYFTVSVDRITLKFFLSFILS